MSATCVELITAVILNHQLAGLRVCQRHTVIIGHNRIDKHHPVHGELRVCTTKRAVFQSCNP